MYNQSILEYVPDRYKEIMSQAWSAGFVLDRENDCGYSTYNLEEFVNSLVDDGFKVREITPLYFEELLYNPINDRYFKVIENDKFAEVEIYRWNKKGSVANMHYNADESNYYSREYLKEQDGVTIIFFNDNVTKQPNIYNDDIKRFNTADTNELYIAGFMIRIRTDDFIPEDVMDLFENK